MAEVIAILYSFFFGILTNVHALKPTEFHPPILGCKSNFKGPYWSHPVPFPRAFVASIFECAKSIRRMTGYDNAIS